VTACSDESGLCLFGEPGHELGGGYRRGKVIGLAGPEMEAVAVVALLCGRSNGSSQMVNFRIGAGGVRGVLAQEAVDDAASGASRERPRQRGQCVRARDRVAVGERRRRLGTEHERRAELRGRGACREHRGDSAASRDATGRHEGHRVADGCADELQQDKQPEVARRAVVEAAAVSPGLDALNDHCVGADRMCRPCLVRRRRRHPDGRACVVEPLDILRRRAAERERDDRDLLCAEELELLGVAVIVPTGSTQRGTETLGLAVQRVGVGGDVGGAGAVPRRGEDVDPERRLVGQQQPERLEVSAYVAEGLVTRSHEPEPAGA
jgi:hypothetical protein